MCQYEVNKVEFKYCKVTKIGKKKIDIIANQNTVDYLHHCDDSSLQ